jgi:Tol biopolymer transport system component
VSGFTQWPEISPDGKYVAYAWYKQSVLDPTVYVQVVELETGKVVPFETKAEAAKGENSAVANVAGRSRWMPDGKALAYIDSNDSNKMGVYLQDFIPGQNTFASRRPIAFDRDKHIESFGISPDGASITIAEMEVLSGLVRIDNIPGL